MIARALRMIARHGRLALVAGLVCGLALPGLAQALRPWIPELVAVLLFLTAFRIGPRAAIGSLAEARASLALVAIYQVALPLAVLGLLALGGLATTTLGLALVLMLSAPSVTGAPNFAIMMGNDPAPALRLLITGTALLPVTVLPTLWLLPGLGDTTLVLAAALRLLAVIGAAVALAFALRHRFAPDLPKERMQALDGLSAVALAIVVIGLMSALGPALKADPRVVLGWLAAAFAANFGLQVFAFLALGKTPRSVPISIIAGNRNIALFLVALPPATTDPVLVFIGCYQVPMYLTPILLRRFYGPAPDQG